MRGSKRQQKKHNKSITMLPLSKEKLEQGRAVLKTLCNATQKVPPVDLAIYDDAYFEALRWFDEN